jgi:tetratricopeptide (TPR) repeat protein
MASSLEQGIEAAKAGLMEDALAHLKDAIVEEPENANVWVWLSAIIEDEDKQTIFLKKAIEIDPGNRPAQRGLAFIERKKYLPAKPGEKLSDYTRPIGVFKSDPAVSPSQAAAHVSAQNPMPEAAAEGPGLTSTADGAAYSAQPAKQRKPWLDIMLYGLTLMVFIIIGILIGSTLLNIEIPFLSRPETVLATLPEDNGVFLMQEGDYESMEMFRIEVPDDQSGMPATNDRLASMVIYLPWVNMETLQLLDEENNPVSFNVTPAGDNISVLNPDEELNPGRYCLAYLFESNQSQNLYWCLIITEN